MKKNINKCNYKMKDQEKLKAHKIYMIQKQIKVYKFLKKKIRTKRN